MASGVLNIDLTDSPVTVYDQNKVSLFGHATLQSTSEGLAVGGPLSRFIDVFTDTGIAPLGVFWISSNDHMFVLLAAAAGVAQIALYDFDPLLGTATYVGKMAFAVQNLTTALTHSVRDIRVYNDTSSVTSDWRIVISTLPSVAQHAGVICINKIGKANFTQVLGPTIPFATSTDQQGVYYLLNPNMMGILNPDTAPSALIFELSTGRMFQHNGVAATHQYTCFNLGIASLAYDTASVAVSVAAPGIVTYADHPYRANDTVVFTAGVLPTGLTIGVAYYVKNPAQNTFELGLAAAAGSITTTGSVSANAIMGRAWGQTGSAFVYRTGNLPALTGTILLTGAENNATPTNAEINGNLLNGFSCVAIVTSSNAYLGRLSELANAAAQFVTISIASPGVVTFASHPFLANDTVTFSAGTVPTGLSLNTTYYVKNPGLNTFELSLSSGGASINTTGTAGNAMLSRLSLTWPSLTTCNLLGSTNEVTTVAATMASWDDVTDDFVYVTNTAKFLAKGMINNHLRFNFGAINNAYYEGIIDPRIQFGLAAIGGIARRSGWLLVMGTTTTVGQRGIITLDMFSDDYYGGTYVTTPVVSFNGSIVDTFFHIWKLYEYTGDTQVYYRTTGFSSPTGNWIGPMSRSAINDVHVASQIQFKIGFTLQSEQYSTAPLLSTLDVVYRSTSDTSFHWEYSHDNSSTAVPTRVAWRMKAPYITSVGTMYFRAHDVYDALLTNFNTNINPEYFEYSTDSGLTWLPLGTIPNVAGTLLRFTFTSPPGVDIRPSLQDS